MIAKKTALLLIFFSITGINSAKSENKKSAQENTYSRVSHYSVELTAGWLRPLIMLAGYDWDELSIKTTFRRDEKGNEKVISVIAWPDDAETENPAESELVFRISENTTGETSFLHYFFKKTKFKEFEIPRLLDLYTYLYDKRNQEMKFDTENLFEKDGGNMHCVFNKKKEAGGNTVSIRTLNSSGEPNSSVEVNMAEMPEKRLERIYAELKVGVKVILTIIKKD